MGANGGVVMGRLEMMGGHRETEQWSDVVLEWWSIEASN
jgi:hypothetical protein